MARITDDDLGVGTREMTMTVMDPAGAICALAERVSTLIDQTALNSRTQMAVRQLLGQLQGNVDGSALLTVCQLV